VITPTSLSSMSIGAAITAVGCPRRLARLACSTPS
jgi:hypothetical protein